MRRFFAVLLLAALAACQVTTSQSMGRGMTIRHEVPLDAEPVSEEQVQEEDADAEAAEEPLPTVSIGGGFSTGISR